MDKEFIAWLESLGFGDASEFNEAQLTKLKTEYSRVAKLTLTTTPDARTLDDVLAARRAEDTRQQHIATLADQALGDYPGRASEIEAIARLASNDHTWSPNKFELELLRAMRPQAGMLRPSSGRGTPDARVIEAALSMTAGLPNIEKHYSPEILQAVDDAELRHIGLQQVILMAACANGYICRPGSKITVGNMRSVLEYAMPPAAIARLASPFSTISLPGVLGAVANKEIVAGYGEELGQEWKEIAITKTSNNFHVHNAFRLTDDLEFEPLGPTGEIKHGKLGQETYTRKIGTFAKMLGLSREAIINDDAGAFDDIRTLLGQGGYRKFLNLFWKTFIDNIATMFTTARGNYIEGAATNLGLDGVGLQALELKFRQMKSTSADGSKRITGKPEILVHPPELSVVARKHYVSENVNTGGASTKDNVPNANVFQGLYRPVTIDQLSDAALTANASATGFGLFRRPATLAPMVVSYLNGNPNPVIDSADADFQYAGGISFRGIFDIGCDPAEYMAGCWSKGKA